MLLISRSEFPSLYMLYIDLTRSYIKLVYTLTLHDLILNSSNIHVHLFKRYNSIIKNLWYRHFLAIVISSFQMFGAIIYSMTEVYVGFKDLPLVRNINIQN